MHPKRIAQWGTGVLSQDVNHATVVPTEKGVQPMEGNRMLRVVPMVQDKTRMSGAYQLLDLRSQPRLGGDGDVEVRVTASFCVADNDVASRYMIRIFALNETAEQVVHGFWPKLSDDGAVSIVQKFETAPSD